jgi:hypothetical protein
VASTYLVRVRVGVRARVRARVRVKVRVRARVRVKVRVRVRVRLRVRVRVRVRVHVPVEADAEALTDRVGDHDTGVAHVPILLLILDYDALSRHLAARAAAAHGGVGPAAIVDDDVRLLLLRLLQRGRPRLPPPAAARWPARRAGAALRAQRGESLLVLERLPPELLALVLVVLVQAHPPLARLPTRARPAKFGHV